MSGSANIDNNDNSTGNGGGIWVGHIKSFVIQGGTISNNDVTNGNGGGIFINRIIADGAQISGVTINNNSSNSSAAAYISVVRMTKMLRICLFWSPLAIVRSAPMKQRMAAAFTLEP